MTSQALSVVKTSTAVASDGYFSVPSYRPHHCVLDILLVEDDASDAMLAESALDDTNMEYEMHTLRDGREVMPYLCRQGKYRDKRKPDIMLLDLTLPVKDGFGVLADLEGQYDRFRDMPIIILTGDPHCKFLRHSCGLKIAAFITKPCSAEKINAAIASIGRH